MIRSVALVGLGAVGAIYANRIDAYLGSDHTLIVVDEERKERYERDHVYLNGSEAHFNYVTPEQVTQPVDLLLIATKNNHMEEVIPMLSTSIGEDTAVLSLLNGIDSEKLLETAYPSSHILYAFATAIDSTKIKNSIDYSTEGIIFFGEKDNSKSSEVESVAALFDSCSISYNNPQDIHREMWAKYMVNVSINTVSAVCRAGYGPCVSVPAIWNLIVSVMKEVIALAQAVGIRGLDESYIEHYRGIFSSFTENGKTSMLQDVEASRVSENRWFCISAGKMAKEAGIATPNIDLLGQIMEGIDAVHASS